MNIDEVFEERLEKWSLLGFDSKLDTAIDNIEEWTKNFNNKEIDILCELLKKFYYYTYRNVSEIIKELSAISKEKFDLSENNSIVSVIRKADGKLGSSSEYMILHKMVSGLNKSIYYESLEAIKDEEWNNIKNIIFVDDCCGTGKTFMKFLKQQKKSFLNKRIIFIIIEIMEKAKYDIEDYAKCENLCIEILAHEIREKAFKIDDKILSPMFIEMSKKRHICEKYIMGYEQTEALMAFYNNTPNNTLGLFWLQTPENIPIFPRELAEIPGWKKLSKEKERRAKQQYEAKRE